MENVEKYPNNPTLESITTFEDLEKEHIAYCDENITYISNLYQLRRLNNCKTDKLVIVCCTCGRLEIQVDDEKNIIEANHLLVIMPNSSIHKFLHGMNAEGKILCLTMGFIENFIDEKDLINTMFMLKKNPLINIPEERIKSFLQLVSAFGVMSNKEHIYYNNIIKKIVEATLLAVFGYLQKMHEKEFEKCVTKMNQGEILFRKFLSLLFSRKSNSRSVSYYSAELFVTPKYLSHVCKELSGKTASQFIKEQIIKDIKILLRFTNKSLKDISKELGFPNESFFTQYVKTNIGYTPLQYRNLSDEDINRHNKELL